MKTPTILYLGVAATAAPSVTAFVCAPPAIAIRSRPAAITAATHHGRQKCQPLLHMSLPTPLDTLTSGMASVCRFSRGVSTATVENEQQKKKRPNRKGTLRLLELYDVENDSACRAVRECITELDLDVERVIPAAANSRVFAPSSVVEYPYSLINGGGGGISSRIIPRLVVQQDDEDGSEKVLVGDHEIVSFLTASTSGNSELQIQTRSKKGKTGSMMHQAGVMMTAAHKVLLGVGGLCSNVLRLGRGVLVSDAATCSASQVVPRPMQPLVLFSYEGNQFCRLVREVLTELDIVYTLRPTGKGSKNREELAKLTGSSSSAQLPFLVDPNTGAQVGQSMDIIKYLYRTYALWTPPNELLEGISNIILPLFRPLMTLLTPIQAGALTEDATQYQKEMEAAKAQIEKEVSSAPVVIYTYELSPFSTETKLLLDNLNVPYKEISLGGEWLPGLIGEGGSQKRAALLEMTGQSSLPNIFINEKSIGGLFSGSPGLVPLLKQGGLRGMVQEAMNESMMIGAATSSDASLLADMAEKMAKPSADVFGPSHQEQLTKEKLQRAMKMTNDSAAAAGGGAGTDAFW